MDRRTALDLLEVVRPDADDLHDPEFGEALEYLETDPKASKEFAPAGPGSPHRRGDAGRPDAR